MWEVRLQEGWRRLCVVGPVLAGDLPGLPSFWSHVWWHVRITGLSIVNRELSTENWVCRWWKRWQWHTKETVCSHRKIPTPGAAAGMGVGHDTRKDWIPGRDAGGWMEKGWETPAFFLLLSSQELLVPPYVEASWRESLINGVCYHILQKGQGVQRMYVRADSMCMEYWSMYIGVSASTSVLPMNTQDCSPLG